MNGLFSVLLVIASCAVFSFPNYAEELKKEITIQVLDENDSSLEYVSVRAWGMAYTPAPKPNVPDVWHDLADGVADMGGMLTFDVPDSLKVTHIVVCAWNADRSRGAFTSIRPRAFVEDKVEVTMNLTPTETRTVVLTELLTDKPIANCEVQVYHRANFPEWFDSHLRLKTDELGKVELRGVLPQLGTSFKWKHPDFQFFDQVNPVVGDETEVSHQLISRSNFERELQLARSAISEFASRPPAKQFEILQESLQQMDSKTWPRWSSEVQEHLRTTFTQLYQDAVWKLVEESTDDTLKTEILLWLQFDYEIPRDRRMEVAESLVQHSLKSPKLLDAVSHIFSYHPQPIAALNRVVNESPHREIQAEAAMKLVYLHSQFKSNYGLLMDAERLSFEGVQDAQRKERQAAELIQAKYSDTIAYGETTNGESATRAIAWLDKFGIGGHPPELKGPVIGGGQEQTAWTDNEFTVLYLISSTTRQADIQQLEALRRETGMEVVAAVSTENTAWTKWLANSEPGFPVLKDEFRGMVYEGGVISLDSKGIRWGEEPLAYFAPFSPIVINQQGTIVSVGQSLEELSAMAKTQE